jgi:hypothetical protein
MVPDNWSVDFKTLRTDFDKPRFTIKLCQPLKNLNPTDKGGNAGHWLRFGRGAIVSTRRSSPTSERTRSKPADPR